MQIHLSPRNIRLTGAIHAYVVEKIIRLEEIASEIVAAHVVLMHDESSVSGSNYCVKVHLAIAGPDIHASDVGGDLYALIDKVSDKLARQLRKRKTRLVDKRRKSSPKESRS